MAEQFETRDLPDGGAEVVISDPEMAARQSPAQLAGGHFDNLALVLDKSELGSIASKLLHQIQDEESSMDGWRQHAAKGLKLLGIGDMAPDKADEDYPEGTQTTGTLMIMAVQRWCANMLSECCPTTGPVAAESIIEGDPDKERPERVAKFFNRYLQRVAPGWQDDHDRTINNVAKLGSSFKKVYADRSRGLGGIVIEQIDAERVIVPFTSRGLESGAPVTHKISLTTRELEEAMDRGDYRGDIDLRGSASGVEEGVVEEARRDSVGISITDAEEEETHTLYERFCYLKLDSDQHPRDLARPYIVTIHDRSSQVLALYRAWRPDDPAETPQSLWVGYKFQPSDCGALGQGLGQILHMAALAVRTAINEGLVAAYLANRPGGFKDGSLGIRAETTKFKAGTFYDVDVSTGDITKAFLPFPFKGADPTLLQLLEKLDADARELAGMVSMSIAEQAGPNTPMGTVLAALDEASIVPASSHTRFWQSMCRELEMIQDAAKALWGQSQIPITLEPGYELQPDDLDAVRLVPVMKPGEGSRTRRILKAQTILDTARMAPQLHDMREAHRRFYEAIGVDDLDALMPPQEEAQPADPVTEERKALMSQPLKAGITQHHQAHIMAHQASMQRVGANPALGDVGMQAASALLAHTAEHVALDLAVQVAMSLGIPLQMFEQGIPPDVEYQIAPMVAQVMQALAQQQQGGMSPEDLAIKIEQIKGEFAMRREEVKAQTALAVKAMDVSTKKHVDRSETARNTADNAMAFRIATVRGQQQAAATKDRAERGGPPGAGGKPATDQPVSAPSNNSNPNPGA